MRNVTPGRRPIKAKTRGGKPALDPSKAIARDLLITAHEIRFELAEVLAFVGDLEDQARRLTRLGGGR